MIKMPSACTAKVVGICGMFDVALMGGSFVGLPAALQLGRTGRFVCARDAGSPHHLVSAAVHGVCNTLPNKTGAREAWGHAPLRCLYPHRFEGQDRLLAMWVNPAVSAHQSLCP